MKSNYYEILGVTPDSEPDEIKSAYRRLARKYHPDIAPDCMDKFKNINEAYETLSNERKRMQYNMLFGFYKKGNSSTASSMGANTTQSSSKTQSANNAQSSNRTQTSGRAQTPPPRKETEAKKSKKKEEKINFEDIFSSKKEKPQPQNGSDLTAEVGITIAEAKNGTSKVVNILHTEQCPKCKGRKFINGSYCSECNGTGEKTKQRRLTVKIPPNVKNEMKLRIKGEGNVGKNGGKDGDLYLVVKIEGNKNVRYEGQTVYYNVPIEPFEAVLGTTVSLKTLEGNILIKIPPRTKSGQKFRVQQASNGRTFEIFVTVHVEIPAYLSDDEVKLYEKLKKLSNGNLRENFIND